MSRWRTISSIGQTFASLSKGRKFDIPSPPPPEPDAPAAGGASNSLRGRTISSFGQAFGGPSSGQAVAAPETPAAEAVADVPGGGGAPGAYRRFVGMMKGPVPQDEHYIRYEKKYEDDEVMIQLDD